ncbi:MAG: hypothetical protein UT91_C0011G0001, partial [Parcubacteria group bacterium GW2011_GWA2_40_23]
MLLHVTVVLTLVKEIALNLS